MWKRKKTAKEPKIVELPPVEVATEAVERVVEALPEVPLLGADEIHPMAKACVEFINDFRSRKRNLKSLRNFMDAKKETNRGCELCLDTLNRIEADKVIMDREALGLAWFMVEFIALDCRFVVAKQWGKKRRRKK